MRLANRESLDSLRFVLIGPKAPRRQIRVGRDCSKCGAELDRVSPRFTDCSKCRLGWKRCPHCRNLAPPDRDCPTCASREVWQASAEESAAVEHRIALGRILVARVLEEREQRASIYTAQL